VVTKLNAVMRIIGRNKKASERAAATIF